MTSIKKLIQFPPRMLVDIHITSTSYSLVPTNLYLNFLNQSVLLPSMSTIQPFHCSKLFLNVFHFSLSTPTTLGVLPEVVDILVPGMVAESLEGFVVVRGTVQLAVEHERLRWLIHLHGVSCCAGKGVGGRVNQRESRTGVSSRREGCQ